MLDPHTDALDRLHEALTDKIASRYKKPRPGEDKPSAVQVSITKADPIEEEGEPDGDEAPPEEPAHSPRAAEALEALKFIRKHGRK